MARQIEYDPTVLREDLLSVFWRNGYAETSLSDLEDATGLNRRQLYNGPGDKKAMFLQALDDFDKAAGREFLAALESPEASIRDICALLNRFVDLAAGDEGSGGCMVCSTSQEEIAADPQVRARIGSYFARIRQAYANALAQSVARGDAQFTTDEIDGKSTLLFGVHVGLCILGRAKAPEKLLRRMANEACAVVT